jgi:hypothetical protein
MFWKEDRHFLRRVASILGRPAVNPPQTQSLYDDAHIFVAAIRVLSHQEQSPPRLAHVCQALNLSQERGGFLCRRLVEMGVIEMVEGAYGDRLFVRDHLKIEDLPRESHPDRLQDELSRFQEAQKGLTSKVETIRAEQARKKKDLFTEMEKKLRQAIDKKST